MLSYWFLNISCICHFLLAHFSSITSSSSCFFVFPCFSPIRFIFVFHVFFFFVLTSKCTEIFSSKQIKWTWTFSKVIREKQGENIHQAKLHATFIFYLLFIWQIKSILFITKIYYFSFHQSIWNMCDYFHLSLGIFTRHTKYLCKHKQWIAEKQVNYTRVSCYVMYEKEFFFV